MGLFVHDEDRGFLREFASKTCYTHPASALERSDDPPVAVCTCPLRPSAAAPQSLVRCANEYAARMRLSSAYPPDNPEWLEANEGEYRHVQIPGPIAGGPDASASGTPEPNDCSSRAEELVA